MEAIRDLLSLIWGVMSTFGQTLSVWDFVDVIIITYLIYRILSFMRKTSASSVIKGIALVLLVAWIANTLNMNVLSYLLRQVLQLGILVIVVLFQPELRKIFEKVGTTRLGFFLRKRVDYETVNSVIANVSTAAKAMAKDPPTGAIIVFERSVGLNDFAVTGSSVDALVSSELLQNIFVHNSPLHDGAVLIREGRLLAAACMLPLSNNINLSRDLGMRHRAAVGISERSDAVAVVISEQTGSISVAIDGMLKRNLTVETLGILLKSELTQDDNSKKDSNKNKKLRKTGFNKQKK
jgi:diadenylate cyclase